MVSYLSFKLTNKLALFFILVISAIIVIDSNVINFYAYTNKELTVPSKVGIFTIFSITFAIFAIVLLKTIDSYHFDVQLQAEQSPKSCAIYCNSESIYGHRLFSCSDISNGFCKHV